MRRFLRLLAYAGIFLLVFAAVLFLLNTSALAPKPGGKPLIIAHRGLGQTFHREELTGETCTAERIYPPEHEYLENTIAGFAAAFAAGADIVEFDVHPTTDGDFVVFHDWTVDCRTEGSGVTREKSLAELKRLDIGHGYTADGGTTFPFRGKGVGLMPTLGEVLDAFPERRFLINIKNDDPQEGRILAERIGALPVERRALVWVYGGGTAIETFRETLPEVTVLGTDGARRCLLRYGLLGWSGYMPEDCRATLFMLPANFAPWVWGFPNRLTERIAEHGSRLVILGPYDGSGFSSGLDNIAELDLLPAELDGYVWTNRAEVIAPTIAAR
jgi:glycerophosphoryl diester phosphodiesterase